MISVEKVFNSSSYDEEMKYWNAVMPELEEYMQSWNLAMLESPLLYNIYNITSRVL